MYFRTLCTISSTYIEHVASVESVLCDIALAVIVSYHKVLAN